MCLHVCAIETRHNTLTTHARTHTHTHIRAMTKKALTQLAIKTCISKDTMVIDVLVETCGRLRKQDKVDLQKLDVHTQGPLQAIPRVTLIAATVTPAAPVLVLIWSMVGVVVVEGCGSAGWMWWWW